MGTRASYRHGVRWIADNDEPLDLDAEGSVRFYVSTGLLADLFGKDPGDVAKDIVRVREKKQRAAGREPATNEGE